MRAKIPKIKAKTYKVIIGRIQDKIYSFKIQMNDQSTFNQLRHHS